MSTFVFLQYIKLLYFLHVSHPAVIKSYQLIMDIVSACAFSLTKTYLGIFFSGKELHVHDCTVAWTTYTVHVDWTSAEAMAGEILVGIAKYQWTLFLYCQNIFIKENNIFYFSLKTCLPVLIVHLKKKHAEKNRGSQHLSLKYLRQ